MSRKFVFIGAGSLDFTRHLVRDLLTFKAFDDCEISLVDINEKRLAYAYQGIMKIITANVLQLMLIGAQVLLPGMPGI